MRESTERLLQSVWDQTAPELSRLVCAMGIEPARAQDVLQDVYLTAWRKQPVGAGPTDLRRWLWRVTTNRCNLEHRRRKRWRGIWQRVAWAWGGASRADETTETVCLEEDKRLVRRALARLKPRWRTVLVLRYYAEFDSKEIGSILQLADSTVRSRLRAARKQLAQELRRVGYRHD